MANEGARSDVAGRGRGGGATRGFLFSDLRGYTRFTELHGAAAAAELLDRYRSIVRAAVAEHRGAEMGTEGDSFYVVFDSVSDALGCGLDIAETTSASAEPIPVGVGIHAGETVETAEGYVGQPVNIAARICALAQPGEVLVSDTVRALTQSVLGVGFASRGRRRLKGIAEPVQVYAVLAGDAAVVPSRLPWLRRRWLIVVAPVVAVALVAGGWLAWQPPTPTSGVASMGISLPLSGELESDAESIRLAIELALADQRAAVGLGRWTLVGVPRDDGGGPFGEDPQRAAADAAAFVADPAVIAMIGPWSSDAAAQQIPITNEAGLLQCSPSNTDPRLTKPRAGALDLRSANPDRINYIRLPAAADIEATAAASFAFHDLGSRNALVIDDSLAVGRIVADSFQDEFEALGGRVVRRALNPGADPLAVLDALSAADGAPTLVFFGGFTSTGAAEVRRAMVEAGHGEVPFVGWDGLWDGSGADDESFIGQAGPAAVGSYLSHPTVGTIRAEFDRRYTEAYGESPSGLHYEYAAAAYACAEIVAQSLAAVTAAGRSPEQLREAIRAFATDQANRFDTVVGRVGFDANGDSTSQVVSFYRVDPNALDGRGDWVLVKLQDFGPAH